MKSFALAAALAVALVTLAIHVVAGGREIARPMLGGDLDPIIRHTLYMVWHFVTLLIIALAAAFAAGLYRPRYRVAARAAALFMAAGAAMTFAIIAYLGIGIFELPQWILFVAMAGFGLYGARPQAK